MNNYYNIGGGCIHADCLVTMADGSKTKISTLRKGDRIMGSNGSAKIVCVIKTPIEDSTEMITFSSGLIITSYHPVVYEGEWKFPV